MPISVMIHLANQEPILAEIEDLPGTGDSVLVVHNPRKRDGKDIHYLADNVTVVIWPWNQITFIEIMPAEDEEDIIGFIRE